MPETHGHASAELRKEGGVDPQSRWEVILSVAHCFSPQQRTPMGCKQSTVSGYKRLTEEDILAIPLLFRDQANRSKTPGMKYWFDTCTIREGTMPLKMGVRSVFCPKA